MNAQIVAFFVFGACFGLCTYSWQHLFSEGPTKPSGPGAGPDIGGRLMWALICASLWPLMVLTGVYSGWRLMRRAKAAQVARSQR